MLAPTRPWRSGPERRARGVEAGDDNSTPRPGFQVALLCALTLAACTNTSSSREPECTAWDEPAVIASATLWQPVPIEEDPFVGITHGDPVRCQPEHYGAELEDETLWFGIDTVDCGYLTLEQPALEALCPGDVIALQLWHFTLSGGDDFEVALSFGGDGPDVQQTIAVPTDGVLVQTDWTVDRPIAKGQAVIFHLSNHGSNSWGLLDIVATR